MALRQAISPFFLPLFSPANSVATSALRSGPASILPQRFSQSLLPRISIVIPTAIHLNIPSLLSGIWESILRAVPKKKTSHRKKRQRFMAGKALKDVTSLNKCSACGNVKRAHLLCPYCVREIRDMWLGKAKSKEEAASLKS
ncbi:hypothetical protein MMC24_004776 [Lignoscripta atroalba]|nr:hypothetical protein [Lignoscripta atroalba]